ncbi:type II secretion system GspH family protein [Patescibacteria group bacterium]|nr:type II secretion system GspH family protein [Patescibacteria group bacterium]
MRRHRPAYTIIELLVAILIIVTLLTIVSYAAANARRTSRDGQRITDVLSIGKAIDQYAQVHTGIYPGFGGSTHTNCADKITGLDTTNFSGHAIPTDPQPAASASTCANMLNGYTYSLYDPAGSTSNIANLQQTNYSLEVGLERNTSPSSSLNANALQSQDNIPALHSVQVPETKRYRFILNGPYCGPDRCPNR